MAKILVTGAAGFIGSHTVEQLLAGGHTICGVDNFRTGKPDNLAPFLPVESFHFKELDAAAAGNLDVAAREFRPDAIIHLAALVSVPESIANPAENDRLNFQATRLVAEAARAHGVKRIVFASSAAVYGANPHLPLAEEAACIPLSPYGSAKLAAEQLLLDLARNHGVMVRCQRYFNVFGPRQDPSSLYSGVISLFRDRLIKHTAPMIHGDGEQTRDFIYVGDVARANVIAATGDEIRTGVANICTGRAVSLNTLYSTLSRVLGRGLAPTHGPARESDIRHSLGNPAKARRELGFTATTSLEDGLRTMA